MQSMCNLYLTICVYPRVCVYVTKYAWNYLSIRQCNTIQLVITVRVGRLHTEPPTSQQPTTEVATICSKTKLSKLFDSDCLVRNLTRVLCVTECCVWQNVVCDRVLCVTECCVCDRVLCVWQSVVCVTECCVTECCVWQSVVRVTECCVCVFVTECCVWQNVACMWQKDTKGMAEEGRGGGGVQSRNTKKQRRSNTLRGSSLALATWAPNTWWWASAVLETLLAFLQNCLILFPHNLHHQSHSDQSWASIQASIWITRLVVEPFIISIYTVSV